MNQFLETYKFDVFYAVTVLAIAVALCILTTKLHNWLTKIVSVILPGASLKSINLIKYVLWVLWFALTVIALCFIFNERDKQTNLEQYFKLVAYLGTIAVITISAVVLSNLWFKYKTHEQNVTDLKPVNYKFVRSVVGVSMVFVGILLGLLIFPSLKDAAKLALSGAGVLTLIVGLGAKEALGNFVGGLFIITFKPFKIGDKVTVKGGIVGKVKSITMRHTVIRDSQNRMMIIPNAIVSKEKLTNYDLGETKYCEHIEIGISHTSDVDLAKKIIQETCENHPLIYDNRLLIDKNDGNPMVKTALIEINEEAMIIKAWAWVQFSSDAFAFKCDVIERVKKRFDDEGIKMPFQHRNIIIKS
ncbi:mechanosensitive ion channel family protein [Bizionia argentinensis JUB59]|uniref:Mechanosensitive ion channel family protein n=1 Tax=Bizionia argentinensis JUB59 TaxID=1046627 RepID=G2EAN2_9FLAO|nr:mechanosensitive ion channel family protein [Bizionia argentinensis]EGV44481.1 mechanosensitive ion channel family protein [Bizionia argentinensis JUB59]